MWPRAAKHNPVGRGLDISAIKGQYNAGGYCTEIMDFTT